MGFVLKGNAYSNIRIRQFWKDNYLYKLHLNKVISTAPTMGFNVETLIYKNLKFQVWDLGGQNAIRLYWRSYYPNGIIYVIDSFDQGRLKTSKEELMILLQEEELKNIPLLILANKQDMQGALTELEICEYLKLEEEKSRNWTIIKCSALTGLGLNEGMEWMANAMKKQLHLFNIFYFYKIIIIYISILYFQQINKNYICSIQNN